jgi:spermidine/putrescine transport system substrate-binding protein
MTTTSNKFCRLLAGLSLASSTVLMNPAMAAGDLNIYNWGEYTPPELIEKFENAYDVNVSIDTYDSMETMLAKLKSGAGDYDIIVPGDGMVSILIKEGLLQEINTFEMENYANVAEKWRNVYWDEGRIYSAPWAWGSTAFVVDTDVVKGDYNTLAVLFDPQDSVKGKINMLRDVNDVINMGLRYLDLPRCNDNPEDLKKLLALLTQQKEWLKSYNSETKEMLVSGEAVASMSWNGYAMRARAEKPSLVYVYPKEGYTGWMDNVAVPSGASNLENAKLFVNFVMDPENAAMITNYANYSNAITGSEAFVDEGLSSAPELTPPAGVLAPEFVPDCGPKITKLYDRVWTKLLR